MPATKRVIPVTVVDAVIDELDHPTDPAWITAAPCRGLDVALFYPSRHEPQPHICDTCPYAIPCVTAALVRFDHYGVWGGISERPRRAIAKTIRARRPDLLTSEWHRDPPTVAPHTPELRAS